MQNTNLREAWSNTPLFQFRLVKSDVRQLPRRKVKFKEDFLNIFGFTLLFFKALLRDG